MSVPVRDEAAARYGSAVLGDSRSRGTLIAVDRFAGHGALKLRIAQRIARIPKRFSVRNGVDLHRVQYWTEFAGRPVVASGLVGVPRGVTPRTTVVWLNGTTTARKDAPSGKGPTGLLVAGAFAGTGHLLLAPDYIGLGSSEAIHPYMHTKSTVDAVIDFLRAVATHFGADWPRNVMLVGYSQGAHAVAAVQRALEAAPMAEVEVVAAASIAPPLDLAGVSFPWAIDGHAASHSTYLAYVAHSYAHVYGERLESVLNDDAAPLVRELFDGLHESDEIVSRLPGMPRQIFREDWLAAHLDGAPSWFRTALDENEAFRWAPRAPLRLYVGDADIDVHPDDARRGADEMRSRGGDVELVVVGDFDHATVIFEAVPLVQQWFSGLRDAR